MATVTTPPQQQQVSPSTKEEQPYVEVGRKRHTGWWLLATVVVWVVAYALLKGRDTKALGFQNTTAFQIWLNHRRDWVQIHGPDNWFFGGVLGHIGSAANALITGLQNLFTLPSYAGVVPQIGWLGVIALAAWVTWALAGLRLMLLVAVSLMLMGIFGYWTESLDLLIVTLLAVALCCLIGLPIGIAMARSKAVSAAVTPALDIAQTLPAFAYLTPFALFFGIGASCALVVTVIYALPPLIRITEHGIRSVPATTIEAARSLGLTRSQMLRRVQLPMARRTIIVGVNQATMAALSIAVIAVLVNGPGLGKPVADALQSLNVGGAAIPGLAIVLMAIMLDRTTTAASERSESLGR